MEKLFTIIFILSVCCVQGQQSTITNSVQNNSPHSEASTVTKVTVELSLAPFIRTLSGNTKDPVFCKALDQATEKHKSISKDLVTLFGESFEQVDPKASLVPFFNGYEFYEQIKTTSTNKEVLIVLKNVTDTAIEQTIRILKARIFRYGILNSTIRRLASGDRLLIELTGSIDQERVKKLLQITGKLEFWETYKMTDVFPRLVEANKQLTGTGPNAYKVTNADGSKKLNNIFTFLVPALDPATHKPATHATVGYAKIRDTIVVNQLMKSVRNRFPRGMFFRWTLKPIWNTEDVLELVALRKESLDGLAPLMGNNVVSAISEKGRGGQNIVSMSMNNEGALIFRRLTSDNIGNEIAILIDESVYAIPTVLTEIKEGHCSITGNFTEEEVQDLANVIQMGKLPLPVRIVTSDH